MELSLEKKDFIEIYGLFVDGLRASASRNVETDWKLIIPLQKEWNRLLYPIEDVMRSKRLIRRHMHLLGMSVEAIELYFLSLWLAEADYVNAARTVLRSGFDAIANGVLLDRIHRTKKDVEARLPPFQELEQVIRMEIRELESSQIRRNKSIADVDEKANSPFRFMLRHLKDYNLTSKKLTDVENDPFARNASRLYRKLSESVHENVPQTDIFAFAKHAEMMLNSIPELTGINVQALFSDFVSSTRRRNLMDATRDPENFAKRRNEFLQDYSKATQLAVDILLSEAKHVGLKIGNVSRV